MEKKEKGKSFEIPQDKSDALEKVLKDLHKTFGDGSIMRLGEATANMNVEVIPTDILPLDVALGVGGVPRGRIIEVFGPESSGKTTVTLHMIAAAQKRGGVAAFIDAEHALDPIYAKKLGVDIENLLISQPDNGEQALEIVEALVRSGAIDIIVVDSVAALVPKEEIDGDMGEMRVGLQARLMSQAMRKLTGFISKSRTVAIFINQIREKVGVVYGNPEVTTGGRALKFYSTIRIDVRKGEVLKQGTESIGAHTKAKIVKNKVAPPFRVAEFDIMYGEGVSREGCVLDMAAEFDVVKKSGSWYSYNGTRLGQGRDAVKVMLKSDTKLYDELTEKVLAALAAQAEEVEKKAQAKRAKASGADEDGEA
ncbi:MAG: recombinase RecA [Schwartzia sp.]|nr:recombinase RecA [Schwartzia sp. (in: firmicutes)]MBR5163316.1 recombinase RecA [Schwartzia sp. (in: firmicutes)]